MNVTIQRWPRFARFASSSAYRRKWRRLRTKSLLLVATGGRVASGPFAGMRYVGRSVGSAWCPKLLGVYELEIRDALYEAIELGGDVVVNLGAAEGYYAVGLAIAMPQARIVAYEANAAAHRLIRRLQKQNGIDERLIVRGLATTGALQTDLESASRPLVVCDVDGGEMTLLDTLAVPALRRAAILVELHDALTGLQITETLRNRFSQTHEILHFTSRPRTAADLPPGIRLPRRLVKIALSERSANAEDWFWMVPNEF